MKRSATLIKLPQLTSVFDAAVRLAEVVPGQVCQGVRLPPERVLVAYAPFKEVVRSPVAVRVFAGHAGHSRREPIRRQLRRDS